ncbi:hypothetical protein [Saccharopolyspora sp. CA-218241]|uniref:hypothetical protein n=1 Tax=Saccharopolyspora sp. CA-218241 TaxID=3240027 RepID=UPI003D9668CD
MAQHRKLAAHAPSAFPGGAVHWRVGLDVCGWRLPSSAYVQDALRAGRGNYENVAEVVAAAR